MFEKQQFMTTAQVRHQKWSSLPAKGYLEASNTFWETHNILAAILLVPQWREFGPWYLITKVFLAAMISLGINYATGCEDGISTTFTAFLCVSCVVSRGLKTGLHVFWAGLMGSALGMISLAVWGLANAPGSAFPVDALPWLRVPLTMAITTYFLFLLKQFDNPSAATSAVFSALYVQMAAIPYTPLAYTATWVQVLVTRILALSTAVLVTTIVNFVISGFFYTNIFRNQQYVVEAQLVHALPHLLKNDGQGEYIFASLRSRINDGEAACSELSCFGCGLFATTRMRLSNYLYILKLYVQLAALYSFAGSVGQVGIPQSIINNHSIEWTLVSQDVLLDTIQSLGESLGWPPMQYDCKAWLEKSLTDRVFLTQQGTNCMYKEEATTWNGYKTNMVQVSLFSSITEQARLDKADPTLLNQISPAIQGLIMSLDTLAFQLVSLEFTNVINV